MPVSSRPADCPSLRPSFAAPLIRRAPRVAVAALVAATASLPFIFALGCDRPGGPPTAPSSVSVAAPGSASEVASASASGGAVAAKGPIVPVLPAGEHPYADMAHCLGTVTSIPLRGRVVVEKGQPNMGASTPAGEMSQKEIPNAEIEAVLLTTDDVEIASLGTAKCSSEGYIDTSFPIKTAVTPGRYHVDIRVKGAFAGRTAAELLGNEYAGSVVRSDIDLTYLDTHFTRKRDILGLLTQNASARRTLPAMEKVYAGLRLGASGSDDRPLIFISGSPRFFKRTLEARMDLDGVRQDGVLLKAFDEIAGAKIASLDVDKVVPSLKEQVGYKLGHLLRGRMELPPKAEEILMGDDSEADFVVYSIYHRMMNGDLNDEAASKELARAGVDPAMSGDLVALGAKVRASLSGFKPVKAIYINLTGTPNATLKVSDWPLPGSIERLHRGAWPLILDLYEEGLVSKESVSAVKMRLAELGQTNKDLDEAAKAAVSSGFLKPESISPAL